MAAAQRAPVVGRLRRGNVLADEQHLEGPRPRTGLRQRVFAWAQAQVASTVYSAQVDRYKRRLFADLSGVVVELGAGSGANFAYFPPGIAWVGIEPNVYMHGRLRAAAVKFGYTPDIRAYEGERLPMADASVDAVVSTLVLCSVNDQPGVLAEILRVLKPGGRFAFVEHVAAPEGSRARRVQGLVQPVWGFVGDGCHVNRDTAAVIERAGFARVEIEAFAAPIQIAAPHIAGVAVKE